MEINCAFCSPVSCRSLWSSLCPPATCRTELLVFLVRLSFGNTENRSAAPWWGTQVASQGHSYYRTGSGYAVSAANLKLHHQLSWITSEIRQGVFFRHSFATFVHLEPSQTVMVGK